MEIEASMFLEDPDDLNVTATITMPLRCWKELCHQMKEQYPSFALRGVISKLVEHAGSRFNEGAKYER